MNWSTLIPQLLEKNRFPFAMISFGILLSAFGAAGQVPYNWNRIVLIFLGIIVIMLGVFMYMRIDIRETIVLNPTKYKVSIAHPQTGSVQTMTSGCFDISGTYGEEPPDGYSLAIIELMGSDGFAFRRKVNLNTQNKSWRASDVWGGFERNKQKEFAIVLVGKNGKALWNYWEKVGAEHNWEIPAIDTWTADILICDRIQIVTRQ